MKSSCGISLLAIVRLVIVADASDGRHMAPISSHHDDNGKPIVDSCFDCCNKQVADLAARRKCFRECRAFSSCRSCHDDVCARSYDKPRQCLVPHIEDGTFKSALGPRQYVDHGVILVYHCRDGFVADDDVNQLECRNGTWSSPPRCVPASCVEEPPALVDGVVRFHSRRHGDRAKYRCNAGYELSGDIFLTCRFGKWSGVKAICETVRCKLPDSIDNGSYSIVRQHVRQTDSTKSNHGDRIQYRCREGFNRVDGPGEATCLDGLWSPPERPVCRQGWRYMRTVFGERPSAVARDIVLERL